MRTFSFSFLGSGAVDKQRETVDDTRAIASETAFILSIHLLPPLFFFDRQGATAPFSCFFFFSAALRLVLSLGRIVVVVRAKPCLALLRTEKLSGQRDLLEGNE